MIAFATSKRLARFLCNADGSVGLLPTGVFVFGALRPGIGWPGAAAKALTGNELPVCIGWPGAAAEVQRTPPWCAAGDAAAGAAGAATAGRRAGAAQPSSVCWSVFKLERISVCWSVFIGGCSTRVLEEAAMGAGAALTAGAGAAVVMATALAEDCMLAEPAGTMTSAS